MYADEKVYGVGIMDCDLCPGQCETEEEKMRCLIFNVMLIRGEYNE